MEELEKNETSTQAEENTVSLASAQALADALAKIEAYTPTTWVDNSSPDIDAEHLNKPEQAIKRVTDALNSAVDVIKDLQSQVTKNAGAISDVNNNLSKFGNLRFLTANTFADAWNKAEAGYTYFIDITSNTDPPTTTANRWFGQMWKNDTGKYGWQVAWSFNGTIYKRERNNSDAWTDWNTYALKSDLDSSKLKSMTFTAMSDEYAQIAIGNPGILICAVSNNYLLARQDNGVCRVIGDIRNNELSFKRNVKVSGIAFYV